jgi:hypothetical protein
MAIHARVGANNSEPIFEAGGLRDHQDEEICGNGLPSPAYNIQMYRDTRMIITTTRSRCCDDGFRSLLC